MKTRPAILAAALILSGFLVLAPATAQETQPTVQADTTSAEATSTPADVKEPVLPEFYEDAPAWASEAILQSVAFSDQGKWLSAWNVLLAVDPEANDPFILARRISIALDGYAQTAMHIVFGFTDLEPGIDLEMVRNAGVEGVDPVDFDPYALAQAIEASGAALPPVLSMTLGDYFSTVYSLYKGQWLEDDQSVINKALEQYERALAYETYTDASLRNHAALMVEAGNAVGAEPIARKALERNPGDYSLSMLLVDILRSKGDTEGALAQLDSVIDAQGEPGQELYDAYIKGIQITLDTPDAAEKYISGLQISFPDDYLPALVRHMLAVRADKLDEADAIADDLAMRFPGNPDVLSSMLSTWLSSQQADRGFAFLDRTIAAGAEDDTLGPLYFYRALMHAQVGAGDPERTKAALADLAVAEEKFKLVFPPEHDVFTTIAQLREQWSAAPDEGTGEAGATAPAAQDQPAATTEGAPAETAPAEGEADATSSASEEY